MGQSLQAAPDAERGLQLEVEDDPRRDVVDDHRPVRDRRDRLEVPHDPPRRWLRVVRGDDEEAVRAELVGPRGQVDGVRGRVGAGAGDHRGSVTHLVHGRRVEREALVVGQRRRLAGRAGDDEAVGAVRDQVARECAEAVESHAAVGPEGRDDRRQQLAQHGPILSVRRDGYP